MRSPRHAVPLFLGREVVFRGFLKPDDRHEDKCQRNESQEDVHARIIRRFLAVTVGESITEKEGATATCW
jgi:hypothetical protein